MRGLPLDEPLQDIDEIPDLLFPVTLIACQALIFVTDIGIP